MATLTGKRVKDTYKDLLQVSNSNSGVDGTLRTVSDGEGTGSVLAISSAAVSINSITYPTSDGTNGQVIVTDGSGNLSFDDMSGGASALDDLTDVTITSGAAGEVLIYNATSSQWVDASITAGEAIDVTNGDGSITISCEDATSSNKGVATFDATDFTVSTGDVTINAERIQDLVGAMVTGNTETNITVTYQDADGTIDFEVPAADLTTSGVVELATVAETNTGTDATRAVTPDGLDGWTGSAQITTLGTIATGTWEGTTVAVDQGGTGQTSYTNGQLLIGNTTGNTLTKATLSEGEGIDITNGTGTITIAGEDATSANKGIASFDATDFTVSSGNVTINAERIQDIAGAMWTGNTETGCTVTYQDGDGTIDIVISDTTVAGDTGSTGITPGDTLTVAGGTNCTTAMSGDTLTVNVDDAFLANDGDVGTGVYDFGGATSFEIPNGTGPTTNAAGEIAMDTNGDGSTVTTGVLQGYDGTQNLYFFGATNYPSSDNDVMVYDSATNAVKWESQSGAGGGISNVVEDTTPQLGGMLDVNGEAIGDGTRELLTFTEDASAVNHINIENQATGSGPIISAAGDDTNIDLVIDGKGSGDVVFSSSNIDVTGNIVVSGTVDGRDVATDGTKLDGIEANATADQTQEEIEDIAGPLVATGGTKTGITVTYQDTTGDMDFVVSDTTVAGDSGSTGITPGDTLTIAGGTEITTAMSGDTLTINSDFTPSSTDTLTNKTFDANGTGNSLSNVDVADLANGTDGELITWDAAGAPATVAVGTSGHVLTSNGAGAAPTFQAAAGGGGGEETSHSVNQTTHGFSVGDVVRCTGANTYTESQADSASNAEVAGVVSAVADTDNFTLSHAGRVTGLSSLTAGTIYYLSESAAGAITATEPSGDGEISKPVLVADTTTSGILLTFRGTAVGTSTGDWELISSATASGSATISFTDLSSTYASYCIVITDLEPATDDVALILRTSTNNGASYDNGASDYAWVGLDCITSANTSFGDTADSEIEFMRDNGGSNALGNATNEGTSGRIFIHDPSAAKYTRIEGSFEFTNAVGAPGWCRVSGHRISTTAVDAVQLLMNSGNMDVGEFRLYGLKDA